MAVFRVPVTFPVNLELKGHHPIPQARSPVRRNRAGAGFFVVCFPDSVLVLTGSRWPSGVRSLRLFRQRLGVMTARES